MQQNKNSIMHQLAQIMLKTRSIIGSIIPLSKNLEKISKKAKICQKYSYDSRENNAKICNGTKILGRKLMKLHKSAQIVAKLHNDHFEN